MPFCAQQVFMSIWRTGVLVQAKITFAPSFRGSCKGLLHYLEGHGDVVSGLIMGKARVIIWLIGVINRPTKSP